MDNVNNENEAMFLSWLSSNVSPAKLSELYLALNEIEEQAKKSKLIKQSLYANLDSAKIKKIRLDIERSKIFKFNHKRQWGWILSALDYLQKFTVQNQEEIRTKQNSFPSEQNVSVDDIVVIAKETADSIQSVSENFDPIDKVKQAVPERVNVIAAINSIHFDSMESMTLTKPISLSYFDNVQSESSWKQLYIDACVLLFEDYPDIFSQFRTESVEGTGKTWLVDSAHVDLLSEPEQLAEDYFVETDWSSSDYLNHLRWILDRCLVDYENVVITFSKINEEKTIHKEELQITRTEQKDTNHYLRADKEAFYRWMIEDQKKTGNISKRYVSAIRAAERFAKDHSFMPNKLFTDDYEEAKATADTLFANSVFLKVNTDRLNLYSDAISMLLTYYSIRQKISKELDLADKRQISLPKEGMLGTKSASGGGIETMLAAEEFSLLRKTLASHNITTLDDLKSLKLWPFMNRYNLYSIGKRQEVFTKVIKMLYPTSELSELTAYSLRVGDECYLGRNPAEAFLQFCEEMVRRYPLQMRLLIGTGAPSGKAPLFKDDREDANLKLTNLSAYICADLSVDLVISYTEWVLERCGEKPLDIAMTIPQSAILQTKTTTKNDDTATEGMPLTITISEPTEDLKRAARQRVSVYAKRLEELARSADINGLSYNEAKDAMQTTMVDTKRAVAESDHIVDVKGRLYHEEAFVDWQDGADQLEVIIDKLMQKNRGYISAAQLYEYAKVEMNMFLTDNDMNDERTVYDIACHLFEKERYHGRQFNFYGKMHISSTEQPVTCNLDIFRNYAVDQGGFFSYDSLVEYLHSIGVASGNLRVQMRIPEEPIFFYYDSGVLIYAENMQINDAWKSAVKKELAVLLADIGGHIVLRAVPDMWLERLPSLPGGKPWTPLLLQSVLRCYSEDLGAKTIKALNGQSLDTLHTMLVAYDSPIQTFGDVVVAYLLDAGIETRSFEAEDLRSVLVDAGIIQGNELIWNMPKALSDDERFAWNAAGDHVVVEI